MAGTSAQVTFAFLAKDAASKTVKGLTKSLSVLGKVSSSVGSKLKTGLLATGAGLAAMAGAAAAAAVAFTKGAVEDEAASARLTAVLKKRKLATQENLAAVDQLISKGAELAFTDDQVRAGIATATQFTTKFADAQKILAAAQDLSRAKGIDLESATTIVGKAYAGNTVALNRMGVSLANGAKGTAALAAINAKFGGSAQAYSETTAGSLESLTITLSEMGEEIGYTLLPIVHDLVKAFKDNVLPVIRTVVDAVKGFITENKGMIAGVLKSVGALAGKLAPIFFTIGKFLFEKVIPAVVQFINKLTAPGGVIDSVMKVVGPIIQNLIPVFGQIFDAVGKTGAKIGELVGILWGDGKGPLATAVGFLGNLLGFVGKIIANIIGAIGSAIDAVIGLGKAIMDSPIGFIIKAVAGVISGVAGAVGNAVGFTTTSTGPTGGTPGTYTGYAGTGTPPPVNVYVGADRVADAVVPVIARTSTATPRSGR